MYDFEVFPNDWFVVINDIANQKIIRIHNDKAALTSSLSTKDILVGFNNYHYDDIILWAIKTDQDPYEISKQLIAGTFIRRNVNCGYLTLDVKQETLNKQLSLKESMAYQGLSIIETPVDFDKEELTEEEIEQIFQYCENDVFGTTAIFEKRQDYFSTKFEIVETFKLRPGEVKSTRAKLASKVLKAKKIKERKRDHYKLQYDKRIPLNEIPKRIIEFYDLVALDYMQGATELEISERRLEYMLAGLKLVYGFGGTHGAKDNYVGEGKFLHIDAKSYYPTLKINNNWISRAAQAPEKLKAMYDERLRLVEVNDSKAEVHKILINAEFGAEKSEYNDLYDPLMFHNTTVNGQLILTHLIVLLEPFCELIQANSDGLIVKYEDESFKSMIDEVIDRFSKHYELKFSVSEINKVVQRDVNNYCVRFTNGKIKAIGCMKRFEGGDWEGNTFTVVDTALVNYYIHGIDIQKTVINLFKKDLSAFQMIAKKGKFDGMVHEQLINGQNQMVPVQHVNRIFATKDSLCGSVYKVRDNKYHKVANAPEQAFVFNGPITEMDKRKIDLNWYVKMIQKELFI